MKGKNITIEVTSNYKGITFFLPRDGQRLLLEKFNVTPISTLTLKYIKKTPIKFNNQWLQINVLPILLGVDPKKLTGISISFIDPLNYKKLFTKK